MQLELPIFRQIRLDGSLPPRAAQVWYAAIELLDLVEYRRIKLHHIVLKLSDVDKSTVSRSLAVLVTRGYLRRQDGQYRVPLSRAEESAGDDAPVEEVIDREVAPAARRHRPRVHSSGVL